MIRLQRTTAPAALTAEEIARLTAEFIADHKKRVWNKDYIKEALKAMSHNKCCYCEAIVDEEAMYMEVEHFYCKLQHPSRVVEWSNLLPSCKRCNIEKGDYDVAAHGDIIDPTRHKPSDHIYLRSDYRLKHKDDRGRRTIKEIYLNDNDRLGVKRFKVGGFINDAIDDITSELVLLQNAPADTRLRRKVLRMVRNLLREGHPGRAYSATAATCILRSAEYNDIRQTLQGLGMWDVNLQADHDVIVNSALLE